MNYEYRIEGMTPQDLDLSGAIVMMQRLCHDGIPVRIIIPDCTFSTQSWIEFFGTRFDLSPTAELSESGTLTMLLLPAQRILH